MALPPDHEFRVVAAAVPQPASEEDLDKLAEYITGLTLFNIEGPSILYRSSDNDEDIREPVYRWDTRPYEEIFETGFSPRTQGRTQSEASYYNLEQFVNGGGSPAETRHDDGSVFVSTTRSSWRPRVTASCILYRYQIYAPGGIDAGLTLGYRNDFPNQREISFAGGICPQYIRSARSYAIVVEPSSPFPYYTTPWNDIYMNHRFDPNPTLQTCTTDEFMRRLRNPECPRNGQNLIRIPRERHVEKRDAPYEEESYADPVCSVGHYIESAFNFSDREVASYLFVTSLFILNKITAITNDFFIYIYICVRECRCVIFLGSRERSNPIFLPSG